MKAQEASNNHLRHIDNLRRLNAELEFEIEDSGRLQVEVTNSVAIIKQLQTQLKAAVAERCREMDLRQSLQSDYDSERNRLQIEIEQLQTEVCCNICSETIE